MFPSRPCISPLFSPLSYVIILTPFHAASAVSILMTPVLHSVPSPLHTVIFLDFYIFQTVILAVPHPFLLGSPARYDFVVVFP